MALPATLGVAPGAQGAAERLIDRYGRQITDLRVSVTRRCNFRCVYCHDEGLGPVMSPHAPHTGEISVAHMALLAEVAAEFGVGSVKFTGGEPLIRRDIEDLVAATASVIPDVSLATNGSQLKARAEGLFRAGIRRVNVSLDSLDPKAFREIRRGALAPVLDGIARALEVGIRPVKLNMVVFRDTEPFIDEMLDFVGQASGLKLQLIQFMPELAGTAEWMVDIDAVKRRLEARADEVVVRSMHRRRIYKIKGAEVEVVDPVYNREFCNHCRRLRITEKGEIKGCINRDDDLVPTAGLDREGVRQAFRQAVEGRVPYYGVYIRDFPERPQPT